MFRVWAAHTSYFESESNHEEKKNSDDLLGPANVSDLRFIYTIYNKDNMMIMFGYSSFFPQIFLWIWDVHNIWFVIDCNNTFGGVVFFGYIIKKNMADRKYLSLKWFTLSVVAFGIFWIPSMPNLNSK